MVFNYFVIAQKQAVDESCKVDEGRDASVLSA